MAQNEEDKSPDLIGSITHISPQIIKKKPNDFEEHKRSDAEYNLRNNMVEQKMSNRNNENSYFSDIRPFFPASVRIMNHVQLK